MRCCVGLTETHVKPKLDDPVPNRSHDHGRNLLAAVRNRVRAPTVRAGASRWDRERRLPGRDIIVIGGSAGAPAALRQLVGALSTKLTASIFVVTHARLQGHHAAASLHESRAQDYAEQAEILRWAVAAAMRTREPPFRGANP